MKNNKNIFGMMLVGLIAMLTSAITVGAESILSSEIFGFPMATVLGVVGFLFLIGAYMLKFNTAGIFVAIVGVVMIVAAVGVGLVQMPSDTGEGQVVSDQDKISWTAEYDSVTATNDADITVNSDDHTITASVFINTSSSTIRNYDNTSTFTEPTLAWSISPNLVNTNLVENNPQATDTLAVEDLTFYEDSQTRNIFANVSDMDKQDVQWTESSSSETGYETLNTIVDVGGTESPTLAVNLNDGQLMSLDTGDSVSSTFDVCGSTWTFTITCSYAY